MGKEKENMGKPKVDIKEADNIETKVVGSKEDLKNKLVLSGSEIVLLGKEGEYLVGGKNYNTAIISQLEGIRAPQFRAISAKAFHKLLDETYVNATLIRETVEREYDKVDWGSVEVNSDPEFLRKFVRSIASKVKKLQEKKF